MGLSSSQARLLNLTARMHQIEYKAARLENMKLQMANESRRVYEDYLDAMDKTKIQIKHLTTDGSITYKDITKYSDLTDAGYALDYKGLVFDGSSKAKIGSDGKCYKLNAASKYVDENGKEAPTGVTLSAEITLNFATLCSLAYGGAAPTDGTNAVETVITNLINSGDVTIVAKDKNGVFHQEDYQFFADHETSVSTNTGLQEVTDEVELKKAEAKYEADMKRIDLKDRKYDTDLAALDTERNAIKQEMETLKTVAKDNVERTFKLFS